MQKFSSLLITLGIAAATLSSCSRSNYAFNTSAPAYLGSERVQAAAQVAEASPAPAAQSATVALPAQQHTATHVAKATVKRSAKAVAHAPAVMTEAPAADAVASTIAKTSYTRVERKAIRHRVKQIIASHNATTAEGKSQLVAVLLCFFLGGLGIHDFYMGKVGKGILQIFLSLLIVGFILVIIDFVRLLTGDLKPKDGDWAKKL